MDRQPPTRTTTTGRPTAPVRVTAQDVTAPAVRHRSRAVAAALAAAVLGAAALAGCSSSGKPNGAIASAVEKGASAAASAAASAISAAASAAASAVGSAAGGLSSAAGAAAGGLSSAVASAEAAASSAIAGVKGGLDAKADVAAGAVTTTPDGKAEVPLTVTNPEQQANRYVIQINFTDASGNVLDATAVTVSDVAAGQSAQATARSNRDLTGTVKAVVSNAVRY
ncbi:hypothetical protein [Kitasatospora sp. NPDC088548]|uniref:hypothetical protein n=1 Tax=Kitasatospora sp. NPDC088548 TaxID=3364075 RepID=UPI0037F906B9